MPLLSSVRLLRQFISVRILCLKLCAQQIFSVLIYLTFAFLRVKCYFCLFTSLQLLPVLARAPRCGICYQIYTLLFFAPSFVIENVENFMKVAFFIVAWVLLCCCCLMEFADLVFSWLIMAANLMSFPKLCNENWQREYIGGKLSSDKKSISKFNFKICRETCI